MRRNQLFILWRTKADTQRDGDVDCLVVCCLKPKVGFGTLLEDTPSHLPDISLTVCSCHVTYAFQSESALYSCLNVKELLARSRHEIWSLSDCYWTLTQDHLVRKRTLNHLAKLASLTKWLCVRLWTKWFWVRVQLQ